MEPTEPTTPTGTTIAETEVRVEDVRPSRQRGEPTTISALVHYHPDLEHESTRYRQLNAYQEYAGESDFGGLLGGRPHLREHPIDDWPVDSHVVPVVYGTGIYEDRSFWGLVVGVEDDSIIVGPPAEGGYGLDYGETYGGSERSNNVYRLTVEVVPLAEIDEYDDLEELLAALAPPLSELSAE